MATNWTLAGATKEILSGNKEAIQDVGRRFPLTANAIASMGNNPGALTLINAMPDYITARKIEAILKDGVQESDDVEEAIETEEEDVKEEKPAKKEKAEKKPAKNEKEVKPEEETADDSVDYSKMTAVELFKLCKKRGIKVEPKQKADVYIKALKAADEPEDTDDWSEEEEEEKPVKKPSKKAAKPAKKEEEEDDDWDI